MEGGLCTSGIFCSREETEKVLVGCVSCCLASWVKKKKKKMSSKINAWFVNIYAIEYSPQIQSCGWYRQPFLNPTIKNKMRKSSKDEKNKPLFCS